MEENIKRGDIPTLVFFIYDKAHNKWLKKKFEKPIFNEKTNEIEYIPDEEFIMSDLEVFKLLGKFPDIFLIFETIRFIDEIDKEDKKKYIGYSAKLFQLNIFEETHLIEKGYKELFNQLNRPYICNKNRK